MKSKSLIAAVLAASHCATVAHAAGGEATYLASKAAARDTVLANYEAKAKGKLIKVSLAAKAVTNDAGDDLLRRGMNLHASLLAVGRHDAARLVAADLRNYATAQNLPDTILALESVHRGNPLPAALSREDLLNPDTSAHLLCNDTAKLWTASGDVLIRSVGKGLTESCRAQS